MAAPSEWSARTTHTVPPSSVHGILTHRVRDGTEQFLISWRQPQVRPSDAVASWHTIQDLERCLHVIQAYIDENEIRDQNEGLLPLATNRKRKSPDHDHDVTSGLLTPGTTLSGSGSPAPPTKVAQSTPIPEALTYNGVLQKKVGSIVAAQFPSQLDKGITIVRIDATQLPTKDMVQEAAQTPLWDSKRAIRQAFILKLRHVPKLYLENKVDSSSPSLNFQFIDRYVLRKGVYQVPEDTFEGCQKCRPNMGQNVGCEYTQKCDCLEYAAVDEERLKSTNPQRYEEFVQNRNIDTTGLPKRFPYTKPSDDRSVPQRLLPHYREQRHPIYECNQNCKCGPRCKSRLVQKGRKVPLTIFKTANNRGWGVYCNEDLIQGQFIDTYLGEVLTSREADEREDSGGMEKNSYLYSLDKFVGDTDSLTADSCYVVDGQYMGGPTRFINHSCEPNCRQYTVSYNKHDNRLYNLAFFAYEDIAAGTELTFDYMDQDEVEEDEAIRLRERAAQDPRNKDRVPCNCGARKCRGFLWVSLDNDGEAEKN